MKNQNLIVWAAAMLLFFNGNAQENAAVKSLSIFKNGQSFVVKEARVDAVDNVYRVDKLPNALFGTYWFSGVTTAINSVTSKKEAFTDKQERKANSFLELLHANKGAEIAVHTSDNKIYKGVVEDFDLPEEINSQIQLTQLRLSAAYEGQYGFDRIFSAAAPVLLLKMEGKWVSIEPSTIRSIEFFNKPNRTAAVNITVQKPIVSIHFSKPGRQTFRYMYLQSGLAWTPVYQLQLLSDNEATLLLQAEVTNEVEDLVNTNVDFVVGVPNFSKAGGLATLLSYGQNRNYPVAEMAQYRNDFSNARMVLSEQVAVDAAAPNAVTGSENEDLYFYTLKNISLEKGGRAQFPLFSSKVKIEHFYKCDLPVSAYANYQLNAETENETSAGTEGDAALTNKPLTVGHYITLFNEGALPYTSGPVLLMQGKTETAVAQDVLPFTPRRGHASIYVTAAPDVVVREQEKISKIQRDNKKVDGYTFALVTVTGTIHIQNSKSKPVALKLEKQITGKMLAASTKYTTAVINQQTNYARVGNANQRVVFSEAIAASGKSQVTYSYQLYLRE